MFWQSQGLYFQAKSAHGFFLTLNENHVLHTSAASMLK
jgi:hypothetical protein